MGSIWLARQVRMSSMHVIAGGTDASATGGRGKPPSNAGGRGNPPSKAGGRGSPPSNAGGWKPPSNAGGRGNPPSNGGNTSLPASGRTGRAPASGRTLSKQARRSLAHVIAAEGPPSALRAGAPASWKQLRA